MQYRFLIYSNFSLNESNGEQKMSTQCIKCGYAVTEPICASCAIKEIKTWIYGQNMHKEIIGEINGKLKAFLFQIELLDYVSPPSRNSWSFSSMNCIRCKNGMHLMCFYCVSKQAKEIIRDNLRSKSSVRNFDESFGLQIYDCGSEKMPPR